MDDIAFSLAKMDVFGKKLQRACTAKCFKAEFPKQRFGRSRKLSVFLKTVYFCNLCGMLIGMGVVTARQMNGYYHHSSIIRLVFKVLRMAQMTTITDYPFACASPPPRNGGGGSGGRSPPEIFSDVGVNHCRPAGVPNETSKHHLQHSRGRIDIR